MSFESLLKKERQKPYFLGILDFLAEERARKKSIYPAQQAIFHALTVTPFTTLKVVIIGQDPYHNPHQANGLAFSVEKGIKPPPSLQNIFNALHNDYGAAIPQHGCLESWARQGVLLLNTVLTVEENKPNAHAHIGWQQFTNTVIETINTHPDQIIYLLWGASAQKKAALIDTNKHVILTAPHPSPLSAYRGFLTCKHFSKVNAILEKTGRIPIDWRV
jgi:uracil-DNA glycosylase